MEVEGSVKDGNGSVAGFSDNGLLIFEDAAKTFVLNYSKILFLSVANKTLENIQIPGSFSSQADACTLLALLSYPRHKSTFGNLVVSFKYKILPESIGPIFAKTL